MTQDQFFYTVTSLGLMLLLACVALYCWDQILISKKRTLNDKAFKRTKYN